MRVLHIMPHLGGGVGKALSSLVEAFKGTSYKHTFILLESPQKRQFLDLILESESDVYITPDRYTAYDLIRQSDIVQIEWWDHPAIFKFLCETELPEMRLIVWSHNSGITSPLIPVAFAKHAHKLVFTSTCSFEAKNIKSLDAEDLSRVSVVSSGVGFSHHNNREYKNGCHLSYGYMGSLNPGKIHPEFIKYLSEIRIKDFHVSVWGDSFYKDKLLMDCDMVGKPGLIYFNGYTSNPAAVLAKLDVFIYLLNPEHYGTAENVLLEAMSLGVIPIVMNNPAEMAIVDNGENGFVVSNKHDFSAVIDWLIENPVKRTAISRLASLKIKELYTHEKMRIAMSENYDEIIKFSKKKIGFSNFLGKEPLEWFTACKDKKLVKDCLYDDKSENTKGSLKHYLDYFPADLKLKNITRIGKN